MNILLIYPKFPETFWSFKYALSFIGKKAAFPPLGPITVASLLPANWSKRLLDLNVDGTTNIIPRMGIDWLTAGYQLIMQNLYSSKNYYRRVRTLLTELKVPKVTQPLSMQRSLSFFRAAFRIGLLGKERLR